MTLHCPTCGHDLDAPPNHADLTKAGLTAHQRAALYVLVRAYPAAVPVETITDRLYAGTKGGGPEDGAHAVRAVLGKIKRRLVTIGWDIPPSPRGRGVRGEYRLEKIGSAKR